jgi:23S rRNA (guanine2445-N2)-methyltransferase / 23S rRNA (guanine2069-N7)-methyltransferase
MESDTDSLGSMEKPNYTFFAASSPHTEDLLLSEIQDLGTMETTIKHQGVRFSGSLRQGYELCLWSRIATRVLLELKEFVSTKREDLYRRVYEFPWEDVFFSNRSFAVSFTGAPPKGLSAKIIPLVIKDGIVDRFKDREERRPSVNKKTPDLQFDVHMDREGKTLLYLNLSGKSLQKREYRKASGEAPLRENTAAAFLFRADWPKMASLDLAFLDPMCGSGTLPIEAAMIAYSIPPGKFKHDYGFFHWKGHDKSLWKQVKREAIEQEKDPSKRKLPIFGFDKDEKSIEAAKSNAEIAGLAEVLHFDTKSIEEALLIQSLRKRNGLIAVNPPYGERLVEPQLKAVYARLGITAKKYYPGWKLTVLTSSKDLAKSIGLRATKVHTLYNGPLKSVLVHIHITEDNRLHSLDTSFENITLPTELDPHIKMFANRIKKNINFLKPWLEDQSISCFRLYDADMPEYAVAIDVYEDRWVVVQEYAPPSTVDRDSSAIRLRAILTILPGLLNVDSDNMFLKKRKRQRGSTQYEKSNGKKTYHTIREGELSFLIAFTTYIDTGLFLDHRLTRNMVREKAAGKKVLNLFGYTGSFTVYAAAGGAYKTLTIDSSRTYLEWARKNLELNYPQFSQKKIKTLDFISSQSQQQASPGHYLLRADCIEWLSKKIGDWDVIILDPPSFSNSKDREEVLDLEKDHVRLVRSCLDILNPGGILFFSTNTKGFSLQQDAITEGLPVRPEIIDITDLTVPKDFTLGRGKPHRCWKMRKPDEEQGNIRLPKAWSR